ncbi:MAG: lysozyme [Chitinophagia bacterium]|jgi:lysozyme|nr:lysozyme [Chitinophagia bacterium]
MKGAKNYIIALAILGLILITSNVSAAALIAKFEGLELEAYKDSAGIWTIGYGNTRNPYTGLPIKKGDKITKKEALDWLRITTTAVEADVKRLVKVPINTNQRLALASLVFNIGAGAFARSTLLRLLNSGAEKSAIAAQFLRWNKVNGKEVKGLTNRRKAEAELFLS